MIAPPRDVREPSGTATPGPRRVAARIGMALGLAIVSIGAGELILRMMGSVDPSGQFTVAGRVLRPRRLPLADIEHRITSDLAAPGSFVVYDPDLGWSLRPDATSADGLFHTNAQGIRAAADSRPPASPSVRVALFGDSFCFGDEVAFDDTWGRLLELRLRELGLEAEVLNFGVNGYGMDQALLRWRKSGRAAAPTIVVLGFQPENLLRNVNVFRPVYFPETGVPLTKPRFVLQGDDLVAVNLPALPPLAEAQALRDLAHHPLVAYEPVYRFYAEHWWLRIRLVALAEELVDPPEIEAQFRHDPEIARLGARIVADFAADARAHGAAFMVVHLPRSEDIADVVAGKTLWYAALLRSFDQAYPVVHPETGLTDVPDAFFLPRGHYSRALNEVVAGHLAPAVLSLWCRSHDVGRESAACAPERGGSAR
jgi:hypothetical protein